MAQESSLTPEKQLLKLIEKPMSQGSLHAAAIKYHGLSLFSLGALKGRFAFLKNRFRLDFKSVGTQQLDVRVLNQLLKFCVFALVLYLAISVSLFIRQLRKDIDLKPKIGKTQETGSLPIRSVLKSLSYYLEKSRERDIFRIGIKKSALDSSIIPKGPSQRIIEATQDLRLVGISWSSDPDAMIEDTKTKRTYFLKKGQTMDREIKVQAIFKDKVVLSWGAEEIDLR